MLVHRRRRHITGRPLTTTTKDMLVASERDDGHLEMGMHRNQETGRLVLLEARSTRLPGLHPHFCGTVIAPYDPKTRPEPATSSGGIRGKKAATAPSLRDKPSSLARTSLLEFARHSHLQRSCPALLDHTERRAAARQVLSLHIKPSPTPFSFSQLGLGKPHAESAQSEKVAPSLRHAPSWASHVREEKGLSRIEQARPAEPVPASAYGGSVSSKKWELKAFHAREEKGLSRAEQARRAEPDPVSAHGGSSKTLADCSVSHALAPLARLRSQLGSQACADLEIALEQDKRELLSLLQSAIASGFAEKSSRLRGSRILGAPLRLDRLVGP